MLTPTRLSVCAAALVFGTLLSACDAVGGAATQAAPAVSIQTQAAPAGDVLYDLAPLAVGETFAISAQIPDGQVRLLSTRTDDGYELSLDRTALAPSAVEIRYLYDGREVAPSRTIEAGAPILAGVAVDEPDSWHYVCKNDACVWEEDFKNDLTGPGGGTRFTTAAGEVVTLTHVAYVVDGLSGDAPTAVQFESPRALTIRSQVFDRTTTAQAIR